nr:MAG TPA: hypothetical protein [Bacteriophage sp.]
MVVMCLSKTSARCLFYYFLLSSFMNFLKLTLKVRMKLFRNKG